MKLTHPSIRAILLGTTLALGAAGCASWHKATNTSVAGEHRGPLETTSDATLTAKVKTAFAADDLVKARNINVDTLRGVVTLHGSVNSAAERDKAIDIARTTAGVVDVKSNLKIVG